MLKFSRLKRLIVALSLILVGLLFGLATVLHKTVVIRGHTTAFVTSYNLGNVRTKQSSALKDKNLIQSSETQTQHRQLSSSICDSELAADWSESTEAPPFWEPLNDGLDTHVRPTAFFDLRRVENGLELPAVKILAMSRNRNFSVTDPVFCSIPSSDSVIYNVQAKASQVWLSTWNSNVSSGLSQSLNH